VIAITIKVNLPSYVGGLYIEREDETLKINRRKQKVEISFPVLSSKEIKLAAMYLKKNLQQAHDRPILETIDILNQVHDLWNNPNFDYRKESLQILSILTGQSSTLINHELGELINLFKRESITNYLAQQFGNYQYLDDWVKKGDILLHAQPRGLILHSLAGNSFILGPLSILFGILTKNINLAKLASSEPYFAVRFVQSINEVDRNLARELGVMYWRGREKDVYQFLFNEEIVDVIIAWGGLSSIRQLKKISAFYGVKFIEHGPKFSFSIISKNYLNNRERLSSIAREIAKDITIWNQYACCSPRIVFVQEKEDNELCEDNSDLQREIIDCMKDIKNGSGTMGSKIFQKNDSELISLISDSMNSLRRTITYNSAYGFAKLLSLELGEISRIFARTKMNEAEALDTFNKRDFYTFNVESKGWGKLFTPINGAAVQNPDWTVLYLRKMPTEKDIDSCVNRFVIVAPFNKFEEIEQWIKNMKIKKFIQTFSILGDMDEVKKISDRLTLLGACTITLPGEMNVHRSSAPHDGAYDLKELVRWVSINFLEEF